MTVTAHSPLKLVAYELLGFFLFVCLFFTEQLYSNEFGLVIFTALVLRNDDQLVKQLSFRFLLINWHSKI